MISLEIPGRGVFRFEHLVSDVNGTLAVDGILLEGIAERLAEVGEHLHIHLLTADTHGKQAVIDEQLGLTAVRVRGGREAEQKAAFVRELGAEAVVALGQGANDALMLKEAALGICVLSREGSAVEALMAADLVVPTPQIALELLLHPTRILASLRR